MKDKVIFLTPDCFLDVDIPIVPELCKQFELLWVVLYGNDCNTYKYSPNEILEIAKNYNINVEIYQRKYRIRNLLNFFLLGEMFKKIRDFRPKLIYFEAGDDLYFSILAIMNFPRSKTIKGVHNAEFHKNYDTTLKRLSHQMLRKYFKLFHFFSKFQANIFEKKFGHRKHFIARLCQDHFSSIQNKNETSQAQTINFIYFGTITYYKGVDILIEAVNCLSKEKINFKIFIAGRCDNWEIYEKKIQSHEKFELNIKMVTKEEIKQYLSLAHFVILPYRSVTQSGVLSVFYNSNIPAIVSDIDGFSEFIDDGVNGYTFKSGDVESLSTLMKRAALLDNREFILLKDRLKEFVNKELSKDAIVSEYAKFFRKTIDAN